jgi:hypothetical protein
VADEQLGIDIGRRHMGGRQHRDGVGAQRRDGVVQD